MKQFLPAVFLLSLFNLNIRLNAQVIYVSTDQGNIYSVDMSTCNSTLVTASPGIHWADMAMCSGSQDIAYGIVDGTWELYQIDLTTGVLTLLNNQFATNWPSADLYALVCDGNGTLYASSDNASGLYSYNMSTNTWALLSTINGYMSGGDLTFYNGVLYMSTAVNELITIDIPSYNTTLIGNLSAPNMYGILTIANGPACNPSSYTMLGMGNADIYTVDATNGNSTLICGNAIPSGEIIEGAASISEGLVDPELLLTKTVSNPSCNGVCDGEIIVAPSGGTPPLSYTWSGGCIGDTCSNLCPGSYIITVTDAGGCTNNGDTITITNPLSLTASVLSITPSTCNGLCDGGATIAASGGTAPYDFSWSTSPAQASASAGGLCAETYTCTVTDSNSCTTTITAAVTEPPPVVIAPIPDVSICTGGNIILSASASGGNAGGYSYSWDEPGNAGFASTSTVSVSPTTQTTYTVNASDIANNCPALPVTVTITINSLPTANAGSTQYTCPGSSFTLAGSIGGIATSGKWSGGTGTYAPNDSTLNAVYTPSAAEVIADSVILTLTTNDPPGGCTPSSSSVTLYFYAEPEVDFTANNLSGCPVFCTNFSDSTVIEGPANIVSWSWNFGDNTPLASTQDPSHCFTGSGLYDVSLTATSNNGCSSTFVKPQFIQIFNLPVASFDPTPDSATVLDPSITMLNQSSSDVNYWNWDFGDGETLAPSISSPAHEYPGAPFNTYLVTLIVRNPSGCYDTATREIYIGPEFTFFIPNAFTPNGDATNDYFFGTGIGITVYDLWIFDRWGNMIFHTEDLNQGWNGKANGGKEIAQMDVFVWKVELTDVFNKVHNYIGTVTLVK